MQPEDIDKLFRERLAEHAPTPPAYLWNQLEEELQPAKKRPVLWMWAAAASVVLLLVSGVLWLQNSGLRPAGSGAVATGSRPTPRPLRATTKPATPAENKNEVAAAPQATTPARPASTPSETTASRAPGKQLPQVAATSPRQLAAAVTRSRVVAPATRPASQPSPQALVAQVPSPQPERPLEPVVPASQPSQLPALALAATPAPATTGPIEVEVRRSAAPAVATAAQAAPARQRSLGGVLLRQARNAVRGERLSLAEAGLPETVTVQAHVAGRTLTKVIQL
ncbi:hypothetical protein [Hymenobacter sp. APR13]|uniref:hypothetical protein n=1 Tax=Hymenobacter sp. APR13 TaxID=1356852 RepID=UPI0004E09546|nr:hypothetical protein [Hymenobacter sp. APR13]AII53772.1 hypothetical protein N008_17545 [Hymenobacter sp. APR13]